MQASSAPPIFRAEVRLLSQMSLVAFSAGGLNQFDSMPAHWLYFETQRDILRSRVIAEQVVDRLRLAVAKPRASQPSSEAETAKPTASSRILSSYKLRFIGVPARLA